MFHSTSPLLKAFKLETVTHRNSLESMAQRTKLSNPQHPPSYPAPYAVAEIFLFLRKDTRSSHSHALAHTLLASRRAGLPFVSLSTLHPLLGCIISRNLSLVFSSRVNSWLLHDPAPCPYSVKGVSRLSWMWYVCALCLECEFFQGRGHIIFHLWILAPHPASDTMWAFTKHF